MTLGESVNEIVRLETAALQAACAKYRAALIAIHDPEGCAYMRTSIQDRRACPMCAIIFPALASDAGATVQRVLEAAKDLAPRSLALVDGDANQQRMNHEFSRSLAALRAAVAAMKEKDE